MKHSHIPQLCSNFVGPETAKIQTLLLRKYFSTQYVLRVHTVSGIRDTV